jgi:hypothetical protein
VSSIPAVKAALVSILAAALPDTQVIYGPVDRGDYHIQRGCLTVRGVTGRRESDSIGLATTREEYTVELVASVDLASTSQQSADELVLADYAAAELAIREYPAGPTLGLRRRACCRPSRSASSSCPSSRTVTDGMRLSGSVSTL